MYIPSEVLHELGEISRNWSKNVWYREIQNVSQTYNVDIDADMLCQLDQVVPGSCSKDEMLFAFASLGVSNYLYRMC